MTHPAIRIDGLGKRYMLGLTHAGSIRELVNGAARRLTGRPNCAGGDPALDPARIDEGDFWALKDVSFEVQPGEVVGIIGKNGAGKSTLLKILSRITTPTTGEVQLRGRVASLLEVGTGFHPELTGRENVYLNGTILGMSRAEVDRRFDAIVDFAGVAKFIDTPVKRYSSGMTVRLGFAVAAHLDPEILIVDEVLAVGDVEFQRRCLGKMEQAAHSGRTVLFVSHNLQSIRTLTKRSILLTNGSVSLQGATESVVRAYIHQNARLEFASSCVRSAVRPFKGLSREIEFTYLTFAEEKRSFVEGREFEISIGVDVHIQLRRMTIGLTIHHEDGSAIGTAISEVIGPFKAGAHKINVNIGSLPIAPGNYYCHITLSHRGRMYDSLTRVLPFEVQRNEFGYSQWLSSWGYVRFPVLQSRVSHNSISNCRT